MMSKPDGDDQGSVALIIAKRAAEKSGGAERDKRREEVGGELLDAIQANDRGKLYDIVSSIARMGR